MLIASQNVSTTYISVAKTSILVAFLGYTRILIKNATSVIMVFGALRAASVLRVVWSIEYKVSAQETFSLCSLARGEGVKRGRCGRGFPELRRCDHGRGRRDLCRWHQARR